MPGWVANILDGLAWVANTVVTALQATCKSVSSVMIVSRVAKIFWIVTTLLNY